MRLQSITNKLHCNVYDYCTFGLIVLATLMRFLLISLHWPVTNSDEGNMGVLALHIAFRGEWPIFFYGLPYMGPIEGYIAAPLFHWFGPSLFTLRLGLLPFYPLFLLSMYYLTRLLFTQKFALFTVLLLAVGSSETISRQLKAVGEYPETIFFAAIISLLMCWLVLTVSGLEPQQRTNRRRMLVYAVLGIIIGVAVWVDMLILPFVGMGFLLLLLFCRRELRSWSGICLLIGIIIGIFPLIIYNLTAPFDQNSLIVLYSLEHENGGIPFTFFQQVLGMIGVSLPDVLNFNPMCVGDVAGLVDGTQPVCSAMQISWGVGYLIIFILACIVVLQPLIQLWRAEGVRSLLRAKLPFLAQRDFALNCCRLMLLVSALGTMLSFLESPNSATVPAPTARYLTCLLVVLPVVLWPLWCSVSTLFRDLRMPRWSVMVGRGVSGGVLILFLLVSSLGVVGTFESVPAAQDAYASQNVLANHLLSLGVTRFYTEYWTCNRLIFQSNEKLICSSLDDQLNPGFDRYTPYRTTVRAAAHPGYVFPIHNPQVAAMDKKMEQHQLDQPYQRQVFNGYVIYYVHD